MTVAISVLAGFVVGVLWTVWAYHYLTTSRSWWP